MPAIAFAESYYPLRERLDWFTEYQRKTQEAVRKMGRSQAEAYRRIVDAGNELETRLGTVLIQEREALQQSILSLAALAECVPLTADVIRASVDLAAALGLTEFDAMVCASIINHADTHPGDRKAFLSYDQDLLRNGDSDLRQAGIALFADAGPCLAYTQRFAAE
jgi:hypothetical protein